MKFFPLPAFALFHVITANNRVLQGMIYWLDIEVQEMGKSLLLPEPVLQEELQILLLSLDGNGRPEKLSE